MIESALRKVSYSESRVVRVTCDRCGAEMPGIVGVSLTPAPPDFPRRGVLIRGLFAPSADASESRRVEAELCASCSDVLRGWIDAGVGAGVRLVP